MKRSLFLVFLTFAAAGLLARPVAAQPITGDAVTPLYIGSDRPLVRFSISGLVQRVEDGDLTLTQISTPVSLFIPLGRTLGVSARVAGARTESDSLATILGVADAQLAASLRVPVGAARVVASLGVNLPTGIPEVTGPLGEDEAATAFLLGQPFYGFRTPILNQGVNIAPGLTLALPLGDRLAIGVGVAHQMRGAFEPLAETGDRYEPGAETLVTGGIDARLAPGASATLDISYVRYEPDVWVGEAYQTGDAVALTAQVTGAIGRHEVRLLGRIQQKADSEIPTETEAALGLNASVPFQARALANARLRAGRWARLGLTAQARTYSASEVFGSRTLLDLAATPELRLGTRLGLFGRVSSTFGTHRSVEAGGGLALNL